MNLDNCQTFDRRGRELELAARPLLVLTCSHAQETITTKPKQKNHLHNFLYKTLRWLQNRQFNQFWQDRFPIPQSLPMAA